MLFIDSYFFNMYRKFVNIGWMTSVKFYYSDLVKIAQPHYYYYIGSGIYLSTFYANSLVTIYKLFVAVMILKM